MSKCWDCDKEMMKAKACDKKFATIEIDGKEYQRDTHYFDVNKRCHDCNIVNQDGNLHHYGCDMERCPKCGGQLISCDCGKKTLTI